MSIVIETVAAPTTTALRLTAQYSAIITLPQLAEIFGYHQQNLRRLDRLGRLPFVNVAPGMRERRYRLADVIDYIDNPPTPTKQPKKKGKPIGAKNKPKAEQPAIAHTPTPVEQLHLLGGEIRSYSDI